MKTAESVFKSFSGNDLLTFWELNILISVVTKKSNEFILAHPELELSEKQLLTLNNLIVRKNQNEPLAYIIGQKEFFGLNFFINKHTLIPRPETELLIEETINYLNRQKLKSFNIIDVGTGSGNIIISVVKNVSKSASINYRFFATDISLNTLKIAKKNAHYYKISDKIKFLKADLLKPFLKKSLSPNHHSHYLILANLPYLSGKIYNSCTTNVKNFEPKNALYSPNKGLHHYENLLHQLQSLVKKKHPRSIVIFFEISPEQKILLPKIIKKYFPKADVNFKKDLARKWRLCKIFIKQ